MKLSYQKRHCVCYTKEGHLPICFTKELTMSWNYRLIHSRTLVVGASYSPTDLQTWSLIDPYYIGLGFPYDDTQTMFVSQTKNHKNQQENPLGFDWKKDPIPDIMYELKQDFDVVIVDHGTWHHLCSNDSNLYLLATKEMVSPDGILLVSSMNVESSLKPSNRHQTLLSNMLNTYFVEMGILHTKDRLSYHVFKLHSGTNYALSKSHIINVKRKWSANYIDTNHVFALTCS